MTATGVVADDIERLSLVMRTDRWSGSGDAVVRVRAIPEGIVGEELVIDPTGVAQIVTVVSVQDRDITVTPVLSAVLEPDTAVMRKKFAEFITSGAQMSLAADASATDTTVTVKSKLTGIAAHSGWVVIDPYTSEAELRKVTAISSNQFTMAALDYAHSENDPVLWLNEPVVYPEFFGAIPSAATTGVQRAVAQFPTGGGEIRLAPGVTYVFDTAPVSFEPGYAKELKISGYGATIQVNSTSIRAFDFNKSGDHDVFKNITLEGFTVDCNNIGGQHHVIIGTYESGSVTPGLRLNFDNIKIKNITTTNVPVDSTVTNHRPNVFIHTTQAEFGEATQNYIKNVFVEGCIFNGGNIGVVVAGGKESAGTDAPGYNILLDNIHIENCYHSLLAVQSSTFSSSNFHIGSRGFGGSAWVKDCIGVYSGDVGVEINAFTHGVVENCTMIDAFSVSFYHVNYNDPQDIEAQHVAFRSCQAIYKDVAGDFGRGFVFTQHFVPGVYDVPFGYIDVLDCSVYGEVSTPIGNSLFGRGVTSNNAEHKHLTIRNFKCYQKSLAWSTGASITYDIYILARDGSRVTIDGVDSRAVGAVSGGTMQWASVYLSGIASGVVTFDINNVQVHEAITSMTANGTKGILIGAQASTMTGVISRLKMLAAVDSAPRGIQIYGTALLTITDRITIQDCDFSGMSGGNEVLFVSDPQNKDQVFFYRNNWMTFPPATAGITPTGSPFSYQNLDGYAERVIVQGGTVSQIDVSIDGSTWLDTGVTAGYFHLAHTEYIRVTYTGAPTMYKVPVK